MCKYYVNGWCERKDVRYLRCPVEYDQQMCRYSTPKEMPWADEIAAEKERSKWWK